jgi:RNA polymerase sigma-70 factor (ECF subfamily)
MPDEFPPCDRSIPPTATGTSGHPADDDDTQLSDPAGVKTDVSSVALDRGLLSMAGLPSRAEASATVDELSDAEVMLRVKAGDEAAFDYLVQKYRRPMINFMYRMAHNAAAAEDLAQEVFLRVYRSRGSYQASAKFTTWLYRIATNLAVNHARDTRRENPSTTLSLDEADEETGTTMDLPDGSPTVEESILRRERLQAIRQKVENLPERQRLAVIMHKYQQMDYKQIGEVLKLSESATKSLLFRAYETLRDQLKEFI